MNREYLVRTLLVLCGCTAFFVLAEAFLRLRAATEVQAGPEELLRRAAAANAKEIDNPPLGHLLAPSPFRDLVYELKPLLHGRFLRRPFQTNSFGMREREVSVPKPPGTTRIVGLGDSVMFGWGVREEETYLRVVEQQLNSTASAERRFQTLNFAVPGYNTAMEAAAFEHKALAFEPDVVVLHFVNNDFGLPAFLQPPLDPWDLRRSFLLDFVRERLGLAPADFVGDLLDLKTQPPRQTRVIAQYAQMVGPHGFRSGLIRLAALTAPRNIPVIILLGGVGRNQRRIVERAAGKLGFHVIRLQPYLERYVREHNLEDERRQNRNLFSISETDHHPNAAGHQIYALALLDALGTIGVSAPVD